MRASLDCKSKSLQWLVWHEGHGALSSCSESFVRFPFILCHCRAALALESLPSRGKQSPAFKQFFDSQLCDDFLCAALDHFAALLRVEDIMHARTTGKKQQDIPPPSEEEKQAAALLDQTIKEVSTYYCYTIMQFSRYKAAQQDRIFFESFYEFTTGVVCAAFPAQHRFKIEDELGRIVRTDTFNLTRRKNDGNHHTKMYFTSRELYVLRFAGDGFMGRKILTGFAHAST